MAETWSRCSVQVRPLFLLVSGDGIYSVKRVARDFVATASGGLGLGSLGVLAVRGSQRLTPDEHDDELKAPTHWWFRIRFGFFGWWRGRSEPALINAQAP